jgi:hypothetical protein
MCADRLKNHHSEAKFSALLQFCKWLYCLFFSRGSRWLDRHQTQAADALAGLGQYDVPPDSDSRMVRHGPQRGRMIYCHSACKTAPPEVW